MIGSNPEHESEQLPKVLTLERAGIEMILIPAGTFLMGTPLEEARYLEKAYYDLKETDLDNEVPQHTLHLPDYYIARTPVTGAQFIRFVQDSGYSRCKFWTEAGWQIKEREGWTQPCYSIDPKDNRPVVDVSWYEALAYAHWAGGTLPSEAEWEKAARGTDGRAWPWGNSIPDLDRCNWDDELEVRLWREPVGQYSPQGDSPYGVVDMAGNVEEWTQSLYEGYPYDPTDGRENLETEGSRVARGGSFYDNSAAFIRCAYRYWRSPNDRKRHLGFRIVVASGFHAGL